MKTCAVIGASGESRHAISVAKQEGYRVVAVDGDPLASGFKDADESLVMDIRDADSVARELAERQVSLVLPAPIGAILRTTGRVNDLLGLFGVTEKAVENCVDKWRFHNALNTVGLRDASCVLARSLGDIAQVENFPCILKPRLGSGSRLVVSIENGDKLVEIARTLKFDEDYVIEDLVAGDEYGIDALVFDGELDVLLVRSKENTPPPVCQCIGYCDLPRKANEDIYEAVTQTLGAAVSALEVDNCVMHADIIRREDGSIFIIEMSPRPSGHYLHNVFTPFCTGVDPIFVYLRRAEGGFAPKRAHAIRSAYMRFLDFENCRITGIPTIEELKKKCPTLEDFQCTIEVNDVMGPIVDGHSLINRGYLLFSGGDHEKMRMDARVALNSFGIEEL